MASRFVPLLALALTPAFGGDWNPKAAADYLDARQKAWFAWPAANRIPDGPCLSCHTGFTYLLARPALRSALGETAPTRHETGLLESVKKRVAKRTPDELSPGSKEPHASEALGVEAVLSAVVLATGDGGRGMLSKETEQAFDRMWSLQQTTGKDKGAWTWNSFDLDPWEEPYSAFYGASLAALAVGTAPSDYQARPNIRQNVEALKVYLHEQQQSQPLHNRLILLWASTKLRGTLSAAERKVIIDETLAAQQADGGWTIESLGGWAQHPKAPPAGGSNSYATALPAFVLERAGVPRKDSGLNRALEWLRTHQDPKNGYWEARSMNKPYDPDSVPSQFMRDAATSFASLALTESSSAGHH
jgi:squalene-hopene/tetraprenyl-beta-curcumene cyclase